MMKSVRIFVLVAVAACGLLTAGTLAAAQQPPPTTADTQYEPVTGGQQEQLPAAPLVIGAYSVVWLAVVFYVWLLWRRLAHVERELAQVSRRIDAGNRR